MIPQTVIADKRKIKKQILAIGKERFLVFADTFLDFSVLVDVFTGMFGVLGVAGDFLRRPFSGLIRVRLTVIISELE